MHTTCLILVRHQDVQLSNLNAATSTNPKSVSLSSGITGKARKERIEKGAGGNLPRLAAALSNASN